MVIAVPSQLNATTILNAKNDQLKCWIDGVNSEAGKAAGKGKGKKVLTKEGKKADLQRKLAEHFQIDLSAAAAAAAAPMPAGPLTVDKDIQKRQWSHLRALGREWRDSARAGHPFTLSPPDADADNECAANSTGDTSRPSRSQRALLQEAEHVLSRLKGLSVRDNTTSVPVAPIVPGADHDTLPELAGGRVANETVCAWMGAALRGDALAASHLQQLLAHCVAAPSVLRGAGTVPPRPSSQPPPSCHRSQLSPPLLPAPALTNSPFGTGGLNARAMELASTSVPLPFYGARVGPWRPTVTLQGCDGRPARAPDRVPSGGGMADSSDQSCIPESVRASTPTAAELPPPPPSHAPEPSMSRDGEVLDAAQAKIKQLRQAVDLRDVIKQVEDGLVPEMRELYGPPPGQRKAVDPVEWDRIKVTVNRHERLHEQLTGEFGGDKDRFFAFFAVEPRKLKKGGDTGRDLRPLRLVAEAIRHMSDDVQDEMRAQEYVDPRTGSFSHERWKERWGSANRWEIWRAIGREYYGPPRQRRQHNSSVSWTDGNNI